LKAEKIEKVVKIDLEEEDEDSDVEEEAEEAVSKVVVAEGNFYLLFIFVLSNFIVFLIF